MGTLNKIEKALITLHEGRRLEPYRDSLGYWTVGVGHFLDKAPPLGYRITEEECDNLLERDWDRTSKLLLINLPWVESLSEVRQYVLKDMCFNLASKLFKWPIFLGQVKEGKYPEAADNMINTLWATQVKARAFRLSRMMETDQWPAESSI